MNLEVRDIFKESSYKESNVFVIVDVIHHLTKKQLKALFNLIFRYANRKVVVIEPAFVNLSAGYGIFGKLVDSFFKTMDYDGFNRINRWFTDEEHSELFQGRFGSEYGSSFLIQQKKVSNHHLITFTKNN